MKYVTIYAPRVKNGKIRYITDKKSRFTKGRFIIVDETTPPKEIKNRIEKLKKKESREGIKVEKKLRLKFSNKD